MRVFLTGATGFIGRVVTEELLRRGDEVVALVRSPDKGASLRDAGGHLVAGDLGDVDVVQRGMTGCDAVIHAAGLYEIGVPASRRQALYAVNVTGTQLLLQAAESVGVGRIVHVSSVAAFGDTRGAVLDEDSPPTGIYPSVYDQTKAASHELAVERARAGAPVVIVQPGAVYGPGDHSQVANMVSQFLANRLPAVMFPNGGYTLAHVDDVASGIVSALDNGKLGQTYIVAGDVTTAEGTLTALAQVTGRRPPRWTVPDRVLRAVEPLGPLLGPRLGYPPNFRELFAVGRATYWAKADKAKAELGFFARPLHAVLRDTLHTAGVA